MDLRGSDLPLLVSLDALMTERNVTKASERLRISQSTLSGHLARLRELFQDPLLVPSETGRGMVPTDRALKIQSRLSDALALLKGAISAPLEFDPNRSERTFTVATNDGVFTILGLDVMAEIVQVANPKLRIAIVPASDANLVERMSRGEIDLFLGDLERMPDTLKARALFSDDFMLAQRRGHPRGLASPTVDEYCELTHVIVSSQGNFSTPVDGLLSTLGRTRNVLAAVPGYNQVALVLSQTDAVATLPRQLLRRYTDFVDLLDLPFTVPPFRLGMGWHPRAQDDVASGWLRACFVRSSGSKADAPLR